MATTALTASCHDMSWRASQTAVSSDTRWCPIPMGSEVLAVCMVTWIPGLFLPVSVSEGSGPPSFKEGASGLVLSRRLCVSFLEAGRDFTDKPSELCAPPTPCALRFRQTDPGVSVINIKIFARIPCLHFLTGPGSRLSTIRCTCCPFCSGLPAFCSL